MSSTGEKLLVELSDCYTSFIFSEDSKYFAYIEWINGPHDACLTVIELATLKKLKFLKQLNGPSEFVSFAQDEMTLKSGFDSNAGINQYRIKDMTETP